MTEWTLALELDPPAAVREAVLALLVVHNQEHAGESGYAPLAVTVRGADDGVVGGLYGYVLYRYLFVELLALGPARGRGLGRQVMALAEAEARRRGCIGIWLDTFTFQAPGFYAKLGFEEFGRITDYPPGHDRLYLLKRLDE